MELDRINMNNFKEMNLESVDMDEFHKIIEVFKIALSKNDINPEGMKIFYQRNVDATSVLGVQLASGLDTDISNYMVNGCKAWNHGTDVNCEVYLHAEAKIAQKSMRLASLISKDIVEFFKNVERGLLRNNQFDLALSIMIPLQEIKEKEEKEEKEENNVKKLIKRIFTNGRNKI